MLADQVLNHRVFGHVLHQIGLLWGDTGVSGGLGAGGRFWGIPHAHRGVGTATHAAAIGLGMLDGMCRQVDLQRG